MTATVPAPGLCAWCSGIGCAGCSSTGIGPCAFVLAPSRTFAVREGEYSPAAFAIDGTGLAAGRLVLSCRRTANGKGKPKVGRYIVNEFPADFAGRAFRLAKVGAPDRRHECFLGADASACCSCEGEIFGNAHKANQLAHEIGDEMFMTNGCIHLDALAALLSEQWFDRMTGKTASESIEHGHTVGRVGPRRG